MSRIITFYSYKGGVGRTFALANIAVLLAKRGKRMLLMDWDLEAPGLHRYYKPYLQNAEPQPEGLVHLLSNAEANANIDWRSYVNKVVVPGCEPIDLIASGDQAPDYIERVRSFSWNSFFEKNAGGDLLDRWRTEWKSLYDFILIDSRTGITDTGGVCTIYLPDILVLVFSANYQSFERGMEIASGVQKARRDLAVPRPPLAVLPLPGRFDGRDEVDEAQFWLNRFAEELKPFYDDWLPKGLKPRQILELTKIPYITKFSFGEPLPVITQGTTDPEFPGFYLENVARLILSDFQDAHSIVLPDSLERSGSIAELRSILAAVPTDEDAIARALSAIELQTGATGKLAEFLTEAGIALFRQQRFDSAESYLRRAFTMSTEALGVSHPTTRSSANILAELLSSSGRLNEAEILYRQFLETDLEFDMPARLATYINLANLCRQMGRLDEALSWYQSALNISEFTEQTGDPAVLATYNSLAGLYQEMGRSTEALESYQRALSIAERIGRPGDPAVLAIYNNLASLYQKIGRNDEASEWYQRALHIAERTGGPNNPAILATYNSLAALYQKIGRHDEAIEWYQRALHMAERTGRPGDTAVMTTYNNLAALFQKIGRHNEAIEWYQRGLHIAERTGRPGDTAVMAAYNNLASLYQKIGRNDEAIECYQRALSMTEKTGRPGDTAVLAVYNNLGNLYRKMGRNDDAISVFKRVLESAENSGRQADSTVMATYNNLASVYRETARREEAAHWYDKALVTAQRIFGPESTQAASQMNIFADMLVEEGRVQEAETLLRQALGIHLARRDKKSPVVGRTRSSLAHLLEATGRSDEAKEIAETAEFDVFISYGFGDSDVVRDLATKLTERGVSVWFDQWQLRPGDSIERSVSKAVSSSASYVYCIGRSEPSNGMRSELFRAMAASNQKEKLIIPILLPAGDPLQIPARLNIYHFLDLRSGITDEGLQRLVSSVSRQRRTP